MASGAARQTGTDRRVGDLTRLVVLVRGRIIAVTIAAGLLLVVAVAVGWIVGGVLLDLVAPLGVPLRMAAWVGWWLAVAFGCLAFLAVPAWRRPVLDAVALRIERALGGCRTVFSPCSTWDATRVGCTVRARISSPASSSRPRSGSGRSAQAP